MKKYIWISLVTITLTSCTLPQPTDPHETGRNEGTWDRHNCNQQAGYERGFNDGKSNISMNSTFANNCREDLRASVTKGYNEGFKEGSKLAKQDEPSVKSEPPTYSSQYGDLPSINVNIGGNQNNSPSQATAQATISNKDPKAYYCKVTAFTDTFDAFGATQIEAKKATLDACRTKNHEMHCTEIECSKNQ